MSKIFIVFKYKLKILLADKSFILAMTLIPLFLTLITGHALKFEKENIIPVAICDLDNSDYSKSIIQRVSAKEGFDFILTDEKTALKMVKDFKVEAAYIIKENFKDKLLSGDTKGIIEQVSSPSTIASDLIGEIIGGEISRIMLNITAADWVVNEYDNLPSSSKDRINQSSNKTNPLWQKAWDYTDSLWDSNPGMEIDYSELGSEAKENKKMVPNSLSTSAFGMLVAFIMFLIMFNSSWLVEERENGTLKRIVAGPGAISVLFIGNILSLFFIGLLQIISFTLICTIIFRVNIFSQGINILIILLYLFSVIAISLFISSILKTPMQLQAGAPLFSIITGFIGGCFWNFTDMGGLIKTISLLTPQGLALDLLNKFRDFQGVSFVTTLITLLTSWQTMVLLIASLFLIYISLRIIKNGLKY